MACMSSTLGALPVGACVQVMDATAALVPVVTTPRGAFRAAWVVCRAGSGDFHTIQLGAEVPVAEVQRCGGSINV